MKTFTTRMWFKGVLAVMIGGIIGGCGGGGAVTAKDFNLTLDVNASSVTVDWVSAASVTNGGANPSASVTTNGTYGDCNITDTTLTYTRTSEPDIAETGHLDTCTLKISATISVTVTIDALYWKQVAAGAYHTVAIKSDGTLWAWGENDEGELGDGTTDSKLVPTQENSKSTDWDTVSAGASHTIAIKSDGTLWAWGENSRGQLGDSTTNSSLTPKKIGTDTWNTVSAGAFHTVAIKSDGTLWAWGANWSGQLGDGTTADKDIPTQENSKSTNWSAVSAGYAHTVATKDDDTMWAWGSNNYGQLGNDTTVNSSTPVKNGSNVSRNIVAAGESYSAGILNNGTLWAWGDNNGGELGDGTNVDKKTPTQEVSKSNNWRTVAAGCAHTVAIKNDGTLWAWGDNDEGVLGDGTTDGKLVPTQESSKSTNWSAVTAGEDHTVALKSDGTLWAWGENNTAQLGDGTITDRHSPIPVIPRQ